MKGLSSLEWHVLDAMADDWESIEQIAPHVERFHGPVSRECIMEILGVLYGQNLVEAMTENGDAVTGPCHPASDWFRMSSEGRAIWDGNGARYRD